MDKFLLRQPNRDPFLFVNDTLDVTDLSHARCLLRLDKDQWFFKCHWEDLPNMPASLQLESMTQTAGMMLFCRNENIPSHLYVRSIQKSSFFRMVTPELRLYVDVVGLSYKDGILTCKARIADLRQEVVYSKATFTLVNPLDLPRLTIS